MQPRSHLMLFYRIRGEMMKFLCRVSKADFSDHAAKASERSNQHVERHAGRELNICGQIPAASTRRAVQN